MKPGETHRFSWAGVSFLVPVDWNLASHDDQKGVTSVRLDDDFEVRLEGEWIRRSGRMDLQRVMKRYEKKSADLKTAALETNDLSNLQPGWGAFLYIMPDKRRLLVAFKLSADDKVFCFFKVHLGEGGKTSAREFAVAFMASLVVYDGGLVPWECYDISFKIPAEFKLLNTSFVAGLKTMVFEWKGRRLHMVFASLADMVLRKSSLTSWAVDFLRKHPEIKGPLFEVVDGKVVASRRFFPPLIHFHEVLRWCFQYAIECRHDKERNMLVLAVFSYRKDSDLQLFGANSTSLINALLKDD